MNKTFEYNSIKIVFLGKKMFFVMCLYDFYRTIFIKTK